VPVEDAYRDWLTVPFERSVLVVVRTVTALTRLLDVLTLVGHDRRVQAVFTHNPENQAIFAAGVRPLLDRIEAPVVPWRRATGAGFNLAITASENDRLHQLRAPVLLVPHGVGYQKYYPNSTVVSGLNPDRLLHDGRVVPAAIAVAHARQQQLLRALCPPAAPRSVVVGDPSLDRMLASRHRVPRFRAELGTGSRRVVVVASTWNRYSLFGRWPDLPDRLVAQLPADEYQVVLVTHPNILAGHGPWQVRAWLSRAREYGLRVVPPEEGWQAALVAADCVLSDQGSLSLYAAALGKPLLLAPGDSPTTVEGSALDALAGRTARFDPGGDLREQIDRATVPGAVDAFDGPGQCAQRLRPLIYRLLDLAEPVEEPAFAPVRARATRPTPVPALVVGAEPDAEGVTLVRYPDLRRGRPHDDLGYRHLLVNVDEATVGQLGSATILCTAHDEDPDALLAQWPHAAMVATAPDPYTCRISTRSIRATLTMRADVDPLLLASLAYVRLQAQGALPTEDRLRVAGGVIEVAVAAGPASPGTR
jgi:hypothetical protein